MSVSKTVKCPYCKTVKSVTGNMQYNCPGCGARIVIDNNGKIKATYPRKK